MTGDEHEREEEEEGRGLGGVRVPALAGRPLLARAEAHDPCNERGEGDGDDESDPGNADRDRRSREKDAVGRRR